MMAQVISNTNVPDDLTRNVLDILYYVPKVSSWKISRNEFMLMRILNLSKISIMI